MKTRIESSNKHPSIKYKLDYRTDEELVESIRKKRSKNLPLDEKEAGILNLLENSINELINISFIGMKSNDIVIEYLEKNLRVLLSELKIKITKESFLKLMYYIYSVNLKT